jgi:molybdopterin synthase catalytic subunit/molybdopterin converting factor small subunit
VRVTVRLFAGLRERAGWSTREIDADTVAEVWGALGLGDEPAGLLYAVNREYAEQAQPLADGDEVALIPPVSGGAFRLSNEALSVQAAMDEIRDDRAGAIATFSGTTRVESRGRTVKWLDYEAYEGMAEQVMAALAEELKRRHEILAVAIHHRVGRVEIGETSVVIAVSAAHRAAALDACREAIDTLKETVPLWKKEVYEGGEEWIGRGS